MEYLLFILNRSLYINLIGMVLLISCACLCGVAIFAYYSDCDPLALGLIQKTDQVLNEK
jgi:sodium-coupled monocarboxylate transporter 8/12